MTDEQIEAQGWLDVEFIYRQYAGKGKRILNIERWGNLPNGARQYRIALADGWDFVTIA